MHRFLNQYFSFIRRLLPNQPQESCIGLDIGANSCKVVELIPGPLSLKVKKWATLPAENGNISESIKKLFSKADITGSNVYTALSGQGTLIRFIRMPRMPLSQLKDSLLLEADKYFPFSKDQVYMDCHILSSDKGKDNKIDVLVAVAKKDLVKQRLDLLASLGFQQSFIGINAIILANAFSRTQKALPSLQAAGDKKEKKAIAILDMGELKTSLVILVDEFPRFTRDISLGGKDLTQKMSTVMGLSFDDAEQLKCNPKGRDQDILTACQPALLGLVSEIRLSFDYFTSENSQEVKEMYLMGGSAKMLGIDDFFSKELDLTVKRWKPVNTFEFSDDASSTPFLEDIDQLGVALGLSLYAHD